MKSRVAALAVAALVLLGGMTAGARKAEAQLVTPYLVAMLSGPISDGASIIILKKKSNFVSINTVIIACAAGFGAGAVASFMPAVFTLVGTGAWGVVDWAKASIYPIYGCVVSGVGGIGGALTEYGFQTLHEQERAAAAVAGTPGS